MSAPGPRQALLVLGMHRAGTSALARVASLLGAGLPAALMPANQGNPLGYWEPARIVAFNDRLLAHFGTQWDDPFAGFALPPPREIPASFHAEAGRLLDEEFAGQPLFVLKDPRCSLLAGFWQSVIEARGIRCAPVAVFRPHHEVVASLRKRDDADPRASTLLYVGYALECIDFAARGGVPFVTYAQLLRDWRGTMARIADETGLRWPVAADDVADVVAGFLQPPTPVPLAAEVQGEAREWADRTWQWIAERAEARTPAIGLEAVEQEMRALARLVGPVLSERTRRQALAGTHAAEEVATLVAERDRAHALFEQSQAELVQAAAARDAATSERDRAHALFEQSQADLEQAATARDAATSERDRAHALFEQSQADLKQAAAARDAATAERDRVHALFEQSQAGLQQAAIARDAATAERDRVHALFEQSQAGLKQAATARDAATAERDRVHALFEQSQAELKQAAAARDAAAAERDRMHALFEASQAGLQQAAIARDAATAERDRVHALFEQSQAELKQAAAARDAAAAERDRMHALFEASQAELARAAADRDAAASERDRFGTERDALQREHETLCDLHAASLQALHERELEVARLERAAARLQAELDTMLASHSWRLTRPLRDARRWAGRMAGSAPAASPLPAGTPLAAPTSVEPDAAVPPQPQGAVADPDPGLEPQATPVPQSLRDFLVDEFGERQAQAVIAGIESHRLPVDAAEIRSPARTHCAPGEALARMHALAALAGPDVGAGRPPDVSIVVPVYNQLRYTLACLDSLLRHRSRYRFEILVGDDASTDATAEALAVHVSGVRHVRHAGNLGFVRNCNATAAAASGRHVVFLNNDTIVLPGWLDELVGTLERDPSIGMAGSKLVFPDGRLQECGAIVWRDGSAWNFGRNDDPRRPEYAYLRDVDYVSGASIALSRDLWERLGGFDELFVPAYAEDADLAFRIRAEGLRTVVQPLSQVLHFEGVSSGTDLAQGAKAYQVRNLERLHERWAGVLATHRDNADRPDLEKERGVRRRVLFVDHCTPTPHEDAGSRVAWEVMAAFRAHGCKVTFVPEDNFAHMGEDTHALQRLGVEAIYHPAYSRMAQFLDARQDPFDIVFLHRYGVGHAHMAEMRKRYPDAKVVFLNADMHFLRETRAAELAGDAQALAAARRTRERELAVVREADLTLVHSEAELALLREECPAANVALFPLVHDPVAEPALLAAREGVCFVGGFRHPPNADGIAWFAREAWPLVLAAQPDAVLHIAGSHATDEVRALGDLPNVEVAGFVPDIGAFLDARRVSVAPLRYGAGAKGKVAESLAHGLPTVGTAVAIEGMGLAPGDQVLVGDTAEALAAHVVALLADDARWAALSSAGLRYAADVTSRSRAHERIGRLLASLGIAG